MLALMPVDIPLIIEIASDINPVQEWAGFFFHI
jgi:hypothetical protein